MIVKNKSKKNHKQVQVTYNRKLMNTKRKLPYKLDMSDSKWFNDEDSQKYQDCQQWLLDQNITCMLETLYDAVEFEGEEDIVEGTEHHYAYFEDHVQGTLFWFRWSEMNTGCILTSTTKVNK